MTSLLDCEPMPSEAPALENARALLDVRGVSKRFGGVIALENVDLQVNPGEILGPSGREWFGQVDLVPDHRG